MPTILQLRRGTTTEHSTFTGEEGEITVDTSKDTLVVHDGATQGGFELALADGSNSSSYGDTNVATYLSDNGYGTSASIISTITDSAPGTLDTLNELAAALGDDANFATTTTNSLALKAPLASPTFTGTVALPSTTSIGDVSSTEISYVNGVTSAIQAQIDSNRIDIYDSSGTLLN